MITYKIKEIINFLSKLYPNYTWDEVEQDIKAGYTTLEKELFNMTNILIFTKQNKNNQNGNYNQKLATRINQYLKILANESLRQYKIVA